MRRFILTLLMPIVAMSLYAQKTPKYRDASLPVEERVQDLLSRMTFDEKIDQIRHIHSYAVMENGKVNPDKLNQMIGGRSMGFTEGLTLTGKDCSALMTATQKYMREKTRLGIPIFTVTESLHGSVHDGSTIFPQAVALGSTFNPALAYRMTTAIAEELAVQGINQTLSPVIDVCRDLRWGRVEECFGEDPCLICRMGVAQVKGYLDNGISPMLKHFGAHACPQGGLNLASVSCGERDLLSVYLKPFETVVKEASPWAVMSSYNSWNGQPNSSSYYLMTELLRKQWGFKGYIYSDWGSIGMLDYFHHTAQNGADAAIQALTAGLDAEASDNCYSELKNLVEQGVLDVSYIDQAAARILRAKFAMGLFDKKLPSKVAYDKTVHSAAHVALAREIADESIVLLKNDNHLLPLQSDKLKSVAIIGPNADQVQFGDYTWSRSNNDGITLLHAMKELYGNSLTLRYAKGCDLVTDNASGLQESVDAASKSDVSIVVVGSSSASLARDYSNATCGEGFDLSDLSLTGMQEQLIEKVAATGKPLVVVLLAGKPFAIPWVKEHVPAIVVQWYPGEQGGYALADMLFGKVNPSGRLNYSFPQSVGHLPCYYNYLPTDKGFYHVPGKLNAPGKDYVFSSPKPLWAFGYGLSYTSFEYLSATTSKTDYHVGDTILVDVALRNDGDRDGKEVPQIYVRDLVSSVVTPIHELKAFGKIFIRKGETQHVILAIPVTDLALYNKEMKRVVEPGSFELQIGSSSDDIRIRKIITVDGDIEKTIPTMKSRNAGSSTTHTQAISLTVRGTVRDVQANPLSQVTVQCHGKTVLTDIQGNYSIPALSTDTITFSGSRFITETEGVDGRQAINIRLRNK